MVQGIIVPASDAEDMRAVELAGLEDYQRAVGGWIEARDLLSFGCTMFLNKKRLIRGALQPARDLSVVVPRAASARSGATGGRRDSGWSARR